MLLCINHNCYLYMPSWGPDLVNKLILISISIRKNCIRMVFCLFCKKNFYPVLFTLLYFIILVVATSFWWDTKNQDKNEQFNIDHRICTCVLWETIQYINIKFKRDLTPIALILFVYNIRVRYTCRCHLTVTEIA